jgi:hypothetical protein
MENFLETLPSNSSRNLLNEWIEKIYKNKEKNIKKNLKNSVK